MSGFRKNKYRRKNGGAALIMVIFFLLFVGTIVISGTMSQLVRDYKNANNAIISIKAYNLAEAGVEDVYYRVKNEITYSNPEELALDGATTTTSIVTVGQSSTITSIAVSDNRYRKVDAVVSNSIENVNILYGALAGQGGVLMSNNSYIAGSGGVDGDVYSNGPIIGDHGTTIFGQALAASGVTEEATARSMVCDMDTVVGKVDPTEDYAQSFQSNVDGMLTKASIYIKKVGAPLSIEVYLVADNAGSPDTVILATADLDTSVVGVNYAWIDVAFLAPPTLVSGQTYWLMLDGKKSISKYWKWCKDSVGAYPQGEIKYSPDWATGVWNAEGGDLTFRLYFGEGQSMIDSMIVTGDIKAHTIKDSVILGDAYYADGTTISGSTVGGIEYPGTPDSPIVPMPIASTTIAKWKVDAAEGGVIVGDCPGTAGCSNLMGPIKIDGNLLVDVGESYRLLGTVYVTGNVTVQNVADAGCDVSFGDFSCVIVADGWIDVHNVVNITGSGDSDSYLIMVSDIKDCLGVAKVGCGPENSGIHLKQNVTGGIYFTSDSMIYLSNTVNATSIVGYKLLLDQNGFITYEPELIDLNFSSGIDGGWRVNEWYETQ